MDEFSKILTDKWKDIIESINVGGESPKIESVNFFRMDKWYAGYPQIEWCYKVTFNFKDGISNGRTHSNANRYEWHKKLEEIFTKMFWDPAVEVNWCNWFDRLKFENSKVDYITNQGYRFIIQFYPSGFISEFREEKLKELGI